MTKKQWFMLLLLFVIYLLMGAGVFYYVESKEELRRNDLVKIERKEIEGLLRRYCKKSIANDTHFEKLTSYCGKPVNFDMGSEEDILKWDFYNSVFFVITVVSTIGYGNLAPTILATRIFMIFYGLIGIPMNGIVMVALGDYFGKSFLKLYRRWKTTNMNTDTTKLGLISQVVLYSIPGFTFFIILPSVIMVFFEGWTYDMAVYYSFVSLTTIGFGDIVASSGNVGEVDAFYFYLYKIFLLIWIIGGLGYVVMILGFITQGMRSKKIRELEKSITDKLKMSPNKIRNELKLLVNEIFINKVKTMYKQELEFIPTAIQCTQSCPDLTLYRSDSYQNSPIMARKRAMSESAKDEIEEIEPDVDTAAMEEDDGYDPALALMQQKDLLLKVVDALSYNYSESESEDGSDDGGVDLFSDKEILASEEKDKSKERRKSLWPRPDRDKRRAKSEVKSPELDKIEHDDDEEPGDNTWYGQAAKDLGKRIRSLSIAPTSDAAQPNILSRLKNKFIHAPKESVFEEDVEKQDMNESDDMFIEHDSNEDKLKPSLLPDPLDFIHKNDKILPTFDFAPQKAERRRGSVFTSTVDDFKPPPKRSRALSVAPTVSFLEEAKTLGPTEPKDSFEETKKRLKGLAESKPDTSKKKLPTSLFDQPESTFGMRQRKQSIAAAPPAGGHSRRRQSTVTEVLADTSIGDFIAALSVLAEDDEGPSAPPEIHLPSRPLPQAKTRRPPIKPSQQRRSSLMPGFDAGRGRRMSLSPGGGAPPLSLLSSGPGGRKSAGSRLLSPLDELKQKHRGIEE